MFGSELLSGLILGVVQGITEFLPISSTGHLILARSFLGIEGGSDLALDAVLHLATAAAVIVYFWGELWLLLQALLRKMGRLPVGKRESTLLGALIVGTIPAVILGLLLEETMETAFRSPLLVAGVLVLGSFVFMYAEYVYKKSHKRKNLTVRHGFKIGLFQAVALIPGVSRSGISIAGGMFTGLSRSDAAEFAFLLSVPVIFGAGMKKLLELLSASPESVAWAMVATGAVAAFIVGILAIHFMLSFVRRHTLWLFIWYRLILAGVVVAFVFAG